MRIVAACLTSRLGRLLVLVLQEAGHEVVVAPTGAAAVDAVVRAGADAVIAPHTLPDMDWRTFVDRLRAGRHQGPIYVVHGHGGAQDGEADGAAGDGETPVPAGSG